MVEEQLACSRRAVCPQYVAMPRCQMHEYSSYILIVDSGRVCGGSDESMAQDSPAV